MNEISILFCDLLFIVLFQENEKKTKKKDFFKIIYFYYKFILFSLNIYFYFYYKLFFIIKETIGGPSRPPSLRLHQSNVSLIDNKKYIYINKNKVNEEKRMVTVSYFYFNN